MNFATSIFCTYANYFLDGAVKTVEDRRIQDGGHAFEWQCCTGTFPQDVAEYANMLYYSDETGVYVSQYLPSSFKWQKGDTSVCIENFPISGGKPGKVENID